MSHAAHQRRLQQQMRHLYKLAIEKEQEGPYSEGLARKVTRASRARHNEVSVAVPSVDLQCVHPILAVNEIIATDMTSECVLAKFRELGCDVIRLQKTAGEQG